MDVQVIVFWSRLVAAALAALGVPLLIWSVARWRPRQQRKFCPGPRIRGLRRWNPMGLVQTRTCGYDLSGLPPVAHENVRCPECGRELRPRVEALKIASRWRPGRLGIAVLALATVVAAAPMLKTHRWQRLVPTTVLIGVKRAVGTEWLPTRLRRELDKRLERGGLSPWQVSFVIPGLQRDLRADKADRNAVRALHELRRMGRAGMEAIEQSLQSQDRQERHLAASALRNMCWKQTWKGRELVHEPSEDLIRISAEGLARDGICWWRGTRDNAYEGFDFLVQFPERAAPYIAAGVMSDDAQMRLLSAGLAVQCGRVELWPRVEQILAEHLANNRESGDAKFAAATLAIMGQEAAALLERLREGGDAQQRLVARALLERLDPARRKKADEKLSRALQAGWWPDEDSRWFTVSDIRWTAE